jgi:hypothetical protein
MTRTRSLTLLSLLLALVYVACGDDGPRPDGRSDAAVDLAVDLTPSPETGVDAAMDAGDAAVDLAPDAEADLELDGPEPDAPPVPAHSACSAPQALSLVGGVASVTDSTAAAKDEFPQVSCGNPMGPWPGPQLYYKVQLSAGTEYKVTLKPAGFDAALYAFPAATACSDTAIDAACAGPTHSGDQVGVSQELLRIKPTATGDWIVVVDAYSAGQAGLFTLAVEEVIPPANGACGQAQLLALQNGQALVSGDTSGSANEFGAQISCGGPLGLAGPQVYYRVAASAGVQLLLALKAGFPAYLYLFPAPAGTCGATEVEAGCAAAGHLGPLGPNVGQTLSYTPAASGDVIVAVDSASPTAGGTFQLKVTELAPPANASCSAASSLTLTSGQASVSGSTAGAPDEHPALSCGGPALDGPQLYYAVDLTAGTLYRLLLSAQFAASLYVFPKSAGCAASAIAAACASAGKTGDALPAIIAGGKGAIYFKPTTGGTHIVAVDSHDALAAGAFSLEVAEVKAAANASCAKAQSLTLSGGKASASGDTYGAANEHAGLSCGGLKALDGPQLYYQLPLQSGQTYKLTLFPAFSGYLYVTPSSVGCSATALETACTGHLIGPVWPGTAGSLLFTPKASAAHLVAVEGGANLPGHYGTFELEVAPHQAPTHGVCTSPKALTLSGSSGSLAESGDTFGAANEFGASITCGSGATFDGPQLYYRLSLQAGTSYTVELGPKGWDGALYLLPEPASCTAATFESACVQGGLAVDDAPLNGVETLSLTPATTGDHLLVVDGATPAAAGPFTLDISWK